LFLGLLSTLLLLFLLLLLRLLGTLLRLLLLLPLGLLSLLLPLLFLGLLSTLLLLFLLLLLRLLGTLLRLLLLLPLGLLSLLLLLLLLLGLPMLLLFLLLLLGLLSPLLLLLLGLWSTLLLLLLLLGLLGMLRLLLLLLALWPIWLALLLSLLVTLLFALALVLCVSRHQHSDKQQNCGGTGYIPELHGNSLLSTTEMRTWTANVSGAHLGPLQASRLSQPKVGASRAYTVAVAPIGVRFTGSTGDILCEYFYWLLWRLRLCSPKATILSNGWTKLPLCSRRSWPRQTKASHKTCWRTPTAS
jgi:hypothetical protein